MDEIEQKDGRPELILPGDHQLLQTDALYLQFFFFLLIGEAFLLIAM